MFSGIIESLGTVHGRTAGRIEIVPGTPFTDLEIGESVAVNGACLTVASVFAEGFAADVMPETLHRTTLEPDTGWRHGEPRARAAASAIALVATWCPVTWMPPGSSPRCGRTATPAGSPSPHRTT